MYYSWTWWWILSWIIPTVLLLWVMFGWGSGRYGGYRTYYGRDRDDDDWDGLRSRGEPPRTPNRGRGPRNYRRSDSRIFEDLCDRLTLDDRIDATDIEVRVENATVTLTGSVATRFEK